MSLIFATQLAAVATAVLAAFAMVTAGLAYSAFRKQSKEVGDQGEMLEVQRRQAEEQRKINELLADDLRGSVEERARQRQVAEREQADLIGFHLTFAPFPESSPEDTEEFAAKAGETVHMAIVSNESRRPIKNVVCRAGSVPGPEAPFIPGYSYSAVMVGRFFDQPHGAQEKLRSLPNAIPNFRALRISPGEAYGFMFEINVHRQLMGGQAVRFTDDAGLHWQIDHDLHLEQLNDRSDW